MTVILKDKSRNKTREFDSKAEAQEARSELIELADADPENLEIEVSNSHDKDTEVVEESKQAQTHSVETVDMPEEKPSLEQDPVDWMPSHFVDTIQGVPTVNRKGYCMIASKYGVSVTAEPVTLASETDFEYAEFQAIAETEDGKEYSGFGSAHVERQDGDDEHLLNELAETRALKRAVAWATGVGLTAVEEMQGQL